MTGAERHFQKVVRSVVRVAMVPALVWSGSLLGQELRIVAEIPVANPKTANRVIVHRLAPSGPLQTLTFSLREVSVSAAGTWGEPLVSLLDGGESDALDPTLADFDGDGNVDLAVTIPSGVHLLKGDGSGRFVDAGTLVLGSRPYALAAGDFDGDGRADLAASVSPPPGAIESVLAVYRSRGAFQFEAPRTTPVTACCGVATLTAADVDGDGRADLVFTADRGYVAVWKSAGDGTFAQTYSTFAYYASRPVIADVDGDGRPDLVYANRYPHTPFGIVVQHNDGGGLFHTLDGASTGPFVTDPIVADLDESGRPSVFFLDQDGGGPFGTALTWNAGVLSSRRLSVPPSLVLKYGGNSAAADRDGGGPAEVLILSDRGIEVLSTAGTRTDIAGVPVLVSTSGLLGSRFESDLLLTNSGSTSAHLTLRYTAASGGGSGVVERDLLPGRQLYAPSAAGFLRDAGLAIADGGVVGTLRVETTGASSPRAVSASVRTTTPAGAGVAYGGVPLLDLLRGPAIVPWLVETAKDRTNFALVNAGSETEGTVALRVTVFPADPGSEAPVSLPDVVLAPGEFFQFGRILAVAGLSSSRGWARVSRVAGSAPFLAWAAINDSGSGDGSFLPAAPEDQYAVGGPWIVPNAVQTNRYGTEFVATNAGSQSLVLQLTLVATGAVLTETIAPGASFYVQDLFAEMRARGLPGAPDADAGVVSPLSLKWTNGKAPLFAGIRVSSGQTSGRSYGVFVSAAQVPYAREAIVPALRQDAAVRTNLGILNLSSGAADFRVDVFGGAGGSALATRTVTLAPNELTQLNAVLRDLAPGTERAWARVTPVPPSYSAGFPWPFLVYAVINDGATPGAGTDDGSFIAGIPE